MKTCNSCHRTLSDDYKFCPYCGRTIESEPQQHYAHASQQSITPSDDWHTDGKPWDEAVKKMTNDPNARFDKPGWKNILIAFPKIAELIYGRFNHSTFRCLVAPQELAADCDPTAFPIHFLFYKNGKPKVAVVISTHNAFNTPRVLATRQFCERHGIAYLRMYASGAFSGWLRGEDFYGNPITEDVVDHYKQKAVQRIVEALERAR